MLRLRRLRGGSRFCLPLERVHERIYNGVRYGLRERGW
jgi:hypothetical protein